MIKITWIKGRGCPKIFCDSCGEEILNAKDGAVVFPNFKDNGTIDEAIYVHKSHVKNNCMSDAEASIKAKGNQQGWEELSTHLAYLVHNAGMGSEDIEKRLS